MFCKYCGKEIEDGAMYCSSCGCPANDKPVFKKSPDINKPVKKKKRHLILGTILLIFSIFIIIGAFGSSNDKPQKVNGTPSPSEAIIETTLPPVFTLGDTLEMGNIHVTLTDVSESNGSQFMKPADGNVFVVCEFIIENNTAAELAVSSMMSFECYFDDFAANLSLGAMTTDQSRTQLDGSVATGKKINGIVGYEAPADWTNMEIRFKPNAFGTKAFVFNYSK